MGHAVDVHYVDVASVRVARHGGIFTPPDDRESSGNVVLRCAPATCATAKAGQGEHLVRDEHCP